MNIRSKIATGSIKTADRPQTCPNCGSISSTVPGTFSEVCESCLLGFALGDVVENVQEVSVGGRALVTARAFGSYALLEEIGRGGMGVIYRAVHRDTGATVALKTVLQEYVGCTETLTRFGREAEAASSLDHPNVMPIYEVGEGDGNVPYFCMKLAESGSLHQLKEKYRGRWRQVAELMVKIAEGVHHAHENGVLHRDLKPGNILFTDDHEPLVTDFGLAKRVTTSDALTQSCSILGTPSYIAPEQAAGRTNDVTLSADVYGLGAILYELLTGRPPFVGDNPLDVLRQVADQSPQPPRRLVPAIPKALEIICLRCLRRNPQHRYRSAHNFAGDLALWLEGKKISAVTGFPRSTGSRWSRPVLLRRAAILSVITVSLGIACLIGLRTFFPVPTSTLAVMIEDWSEDASLANFALESTVGFERCLAQSRVFGLRSRTVASAPLPEATFDPVAYGRSNNAHLMLTGCVRRSGNNVRLITRLVNCDSGKVVWHHIDSFASDRADKMLPAALSAMVNGIESKWYANSTTFLQPPGIAPSSEAQKLYTRGMELVARTNRRDLDTAVTLMQKAVEVDPHFALASGTLAFARWTQADIFGEMDKLPLAMAAARRTLDLDPDSAQAHRVIASCYSKAVRHDMALEEYWTALEIDPQSVGCCQSLAMCFRDMGQPRRSVGWLKRAINLDPGRGACYWSLAELLAILGDDREAEADFSRAIELDGEQPDLAIDFSVLRTWQKRFTEARQLCVEARGHTPDSRFGANLAAWIEFCAGNDAVAEADYESLRSNNSYQQNWEFYGAVNPVSALAYLAKKAGCIERARLLEAEAFDIDQKLLIKYPHNARILHDLAATCSLAGRTDQGIDYLEKSIAAGWAERRSTAIDPRFSGVTSLPRFRDLIRTNLESAL